MLIAQDLKKGLFIQYENSIHQVLDCQYHRGQGKMGNFMHLKIKDVSTGRIHEIHVDPQEKVDDVEIERRHMKYLYEDATGLCFMDPENFEQVTVKAEAVGPGKEYLMEDTEVEIALHNGAPIYVNLPNKITLEVTSTADPIKGETDSVYKSATLSNGLDILVPQFIKMGDKVVVDTATGKYTERAK
jgi:elongation factor P